MAIQGCLAIVACRVILALACLDTVAFPVTQALDCPVIQAIQELAATPVAALADTAANQVCQAIVDCQAIAALANLVIAESQVFQDTAVLEFQDLAVSVVTLDRESADFLVKAAIPAFLVTVDQALAATVANPATAAFQAIQDRAFPAIAVQADIPAAESQATAEVAFQDLAGIRGDPATAECRARLVLVAHRVTGDRSGLQQAKPQRQTPRL